MALRDSFFAVKQLFTNPELKWNEEAFVEVVVEEEGVAVVVVEVAAAAVVRLAQTCKSS
jgi:phosphatidylserine decarboxylase